MKIRSAIGSLSGAFCLAAVPAAAMTFQSVVVDGRPGVVAVGQITLDTPSAFAAVPATSRRVYISSPGGNVGAALELGSLFRQRGITAIVAGVTQTGSTTAGGCFSACVYALVGASRRVVPGGSRVGIHRMQAVSEEIAGAGERAERRAAASMLKGYTVRMGVDPSMIAVAEDTPSPSIHVLTQAELRRWGVVGMR